MAETIPGLDDVIRKPLWSMGYGVLPKNNQKLYLLSIKQYDRALMVELLPEKSIDGTFLRFCLRSLEKELNTVHSLVFSRRFLIY